MGLRVSVGWDEKLPKNHKNSSLQGQDLVYLKFLKCVSIVFLSKKHDMLQWTWHPLELTLLIIFDLLYTTDPQGFVEDQVHHCQGFGFLFQIYLRLFIFKCMCGGGKVKDDRERF